MFKSLQIIFFGTQPRAKVTDKTLQQIINRDFGNRANEVGQKLQQIKSDTSNGRNRISAAILKPANKNFNALDRLVEISNNDFRDIISEAEYPTYSNFAFTDISKDKKRQLYLTDWKQYSKWLHGA
jgi:hypothetical protein